MSKPQNPYLMLPAPGGSEITLRDILAGFALAGILAGGKTGINGEEMGADLMAYRMADAMLAARAKP